LFPPPGGGSKVGVNYPPHPNPLPQRGEEMIRNPPRLKGSIRRR